MRTDTDVLRDEVFRRKILHIIGSVIVALLLLNNVLFLLDDLLELVANQIRDVLESLRHAHLVFLGSTDPVEVGIELAGDLGGPIRNLVANQMDVLLPVVDNLIILLILRDLVQQLNDLLALLRHAEALAAVRILLLAVVVNLQNMQNFLFLIVLLS